MSPSKYLPSAQFVVIVASIALSGGLIVAAQYVTQPKTSSAVITSTPTSQGALADVNWQETLRIIQGQSSTPAPTAPDADAVGALLSAAQTSNLTNTIGRTLLINLSDAKSQGLGSDIPTQDKIIAQAQAQIDSSHSTPQYTSADLQISVQTGATLKAYGNSVMATVRAHPIANYDNTVLAVGNAVDTGSSDSLWQLPAIQKEYAAMARELAALSVPTTLAPLHLKVVNDLLLVADSYAGMNVVLSDPLRAVAGLQTYQSLTDELGRVFINIAQTFTQNGILFNKDEPGNAWNAVSTLQ